MSESTKFHIEIKLEEGGPWIHHHRTSILYDSRIKDLMISHGTDSRGNKILSTYTPEDLYEISKRYTSNPDVSDWGAISVQDAKNLVDWFLMLMAWSETRVSLFTPFGYVFGCHIWETEESFEKLHDIRVIFVID